MCKFLPGRGLPGHKGVYVGRRPINSASMDKRTIIVVLTFSARPRLHARKSIEHISIQGNRVRPLFGTKVGDHCEKALTLEPIALFDSLLC